MQLGQNSRTITNLIADVLREVRGQATVFEAQQAIQDAFSFIDASANWEFLIATQAYSTVAAYSTGTVSCADSVNVTLTGGTWSTFSNSSRYAEIKVFGRDMPYKTTGVSSGSLVIDGGIPNGGTFSGATYVLYQARYPLPSDCEPGRDLSLKGMITLGYNGNIPKRQRLIYDRHNQPVFQLGVPAYYTDDEFDGYNNIPTFRIEPYPARVYDLRLTYYRSLWVPVPGPTVSNATTQTQQILAIPVAFQRVPILMASAAIMRKKNMTGWQIVRQEALDLMNKMYARYATSAAYENKINPQDYVGEMDDIFGFDGVMYVNG